MNHEKYIKRCFSLARRGGKFTKSNPQVGAVLVHNEKIVGEGYHKFFGGPHAEVNCLQNVKNKDLIPDSTLYVSLEPCCISGKTPPCTELIIRSGIKKVVISALDVNPMVNGKGVSDLEANGIQVISGIAKEQGESLIRKFKINNLGKRPYIVLKIVKSKDNYIGRPNEKIWLSNDLTDIYTHKIRSQVDAIMVGSNTIINDNPTLTTRNYPGENPIRITIDRNAKIPESVNFFILPGTAVYFSKSNRNLHENIHQISLNSIDHVLSQVLESLFQMGICSVLVEGGKNLINSFLKENFWDEALVISTEKKLLEGIPAPNIHGRLAEEFFIATDKIQKIYPDF